MGIFTHFSLGLLCCVGVQPASAQLLTDDRISVEVSRLLRWKTFWGGPKAVPSLRPAMAVDATVVSSNDETVVFIEELRTAIFFSTEGGVIVKRVIAELNAGRTVTAVEAYLSGKRGVAGFVLRPEVPEQRPGLPIRKQSNERDETSTMTRTMQLNFEPMAPPDYILFGTRPPELGALEAITRERISGYRDPSCGGSSVIIPFFSSEDPSVYVYVDFGGRCGSGIFPFVRDHARWTAGQFSPIRPPNDWSYTVGQIKKHSVSRFSLR